MKTYFLIPLLFLGITLHAQVVATNAALSSTPGTGGAATLTSVVMTGFSPHTFIMTNGTLQVASSSSETNIYWSADGVTYQLGSAPTGSAYYIKVLATGQDLTSADDLEFSNSTTTGLIDVTSAGNGFAIAYNGEIWTDPTVYDVYVMTSGGSTVLFPTGKTMTFTSAPPALVQTAHQYPSSSATFTNPVTAGNMLIAYTSGGTGTVTTGLTDTLGNYWNYLTNTTFVSLDGYTVQIQCYYCISASSGSDTITFTTPAGDAGVTLAEVSNVTTVEDKNYVQATSSTSTAVSGIVTATGTSNFLLAFYADEFSSYISTVNSPWTLMEIDNSHYDGSAYYAGASSGAYSVTFNLSGSSQSWCVFTITCK